MFTSVASCNEAIQVSGSPFKWVCKGLQVSKSNKKTMDTKHHHIQDHVKFQFAISTGLAGDKTDGCFSQILP